MELSQRQHDHNDRNNSPTASFLEPIANLFFTTVKSTRMDTKYPQYRLRTTSLKGNIEVEKYLNLYPLFGTKYLDSLDWFKVLTYFKLKQHIKAAKEISYIKSNMNDNRTVYT